MLFCIVRMSEQLFFVFSPVSDNSVLIMPDFVLILVVYSSPHGFTIFYIFYYLIGEGRLFPVGRAVYMYRKEMRTMLMFSFQYRILCVFSG